MKNPFLSFSLKAVSFLVAAFCIHISILSILQLSLLDNKIILSYIINLVLIISIFGILYLLKEKYKTQLGFLFLAGSLLKFAVFFIVFYPVFKLDGIVTKLEFASFFVPYITGLVIETISLSKWLNKLD